MEVILAQSAGFCMGVSLALEKLETVLDEAEPGEAIHTLGPIIHNPQVLAEFEARGVACIARPEEARAGSTVVIRAHGIPRQTEEILRARGVTVIDATCPKVSTAQKLISRETARGRSLLLLGEAHHPEVRGLLSYASPDAVVFETLEELKSRLVPGKDYVLAAQTTQDREMFEKVRKYLRERLGDDVPVLETICDATKVRQEEAIAIARQVDKMVVAGGYESGNTRRLAQVVAAQGAPCVHVETADQLRREDFAGCRKIGLTAGASTPDKIIREIHAVLASF
ncbi:MAG: 4-hydroxy-3-methylbut-2-enyl diphosphate reductase [Thermodesulfobacteriota bacterium]